MRTASPLDDALAAIARSCVIVVIPLILLVAACGRGGEEGGSEMLLLVLVTMWSALLLVSLVDRATVGPDREVGSVARAAAPLLLTLAPAAILGWFLLGGVDFPDGVGVVILLAEIGGFVGFLACVMLLAHEPSEVERNARAFRRHARPAFESAALDRRDRTVEIESPSGTPSESSAPKEETRAAEEEDRSRAERPAGGRGLRPEREDPQG